MAINRVGIDLKYDDFYDHGNGVITLYYESKPLTHEESKLLSKLFPRLTDTAYELLRQETLLANLATGADLAAPKKKIDVEPVQWEVQR